MRARKDDLVKPEGVSYEQWLVGLESDRADLNRQIRREVHTRGFAHGKYSERLDRAILFARTHIASALLLASGADQ